MLGRPLGTLRERGVVVAVVVVFYCSNRSSTVVVVAAAAIRRWSVRGAVGRLCVALRCVRATDRERHRVGESGRVLERERVCAREKE